MKIVDLRGKLRVHKTKRYSTRKLTDIRSIGIHNSLTLSGSPEAFAGYHINTNNWPGIAYAFVIQRDGTVYWCWDYTVVTYHVGNSNKHAIGICMVGDFRTQQPTPEQYAAAVELTRMLQQDIPTAKQVLGHSEYPGYSWKACPVIDMDRFRADVAQTQNGEDEEEMSEAAIEGFERRLASLEHSKDVLKGESLKQAKVIKDQAEQILRLESRATLPDVPAWATKAVNAAVAAGLIDTPEGGSYDFYRLMAVLHRAGLLITINEEGR